MTKRGFHESAQRTISPREMGRGMSLKAVVGHTEARIDGRLRGHRQPHSSGNSGRNSGKHLVLGFQRSLFFTKDHGAQCWCASYTVGHTAVPSTGEKRASEDFHGLQKGCIRKQ